MRPQLKQLTRRQAGAKSQGNWLRDCCVRGACDRGTRIPPYTEEQQCAHARGHLNTDNTTHVGSNTTRTEGEGTHQTMPVAVCVLFDCSLLVLLPGDDTNSFLCMPRGQVAGVVLVRLRLLLLLLRLILHAV